MSSVKDLLRGNVVDGSGTANYIPKWSDTDTITNSIIQDDGSLVTIGGEIRTASQIRIGPDLAGTNTAFIKWQGVNPLNANQNTLGIFTWGDGPNIQIGGGATIFKREAFEDTERARIDADGLKFNGDTAAANALDDYEEGTWTPTAYGNTTAGTTTYTTQIGYYTKIGRQVNVTCYIRYSGMNGTGTLIIGGLPFTIGNLTASQNYPAGAVEPNGLNFTAGTSIVTLGINNANHMIAVCFGDNLQSVAQECTNEDVAFRITMTYFTA